MSTRSHPPSWRLGHTLRQHALLLALLAGTFFTGSLPVYAMAPSNSVNSTETEVSLTGGQLTITDVNGGASNDTLTLSINGANLRVSDPGNTLAGSGTGVVQVDANTVDVPLANITDGVTIDTVAGVDTVNLNAALTLGNGDLTVTAQTINVNAPVTVSGSAVISLTARQNMNVNSNGPLVSADGDITLRANQGSTPVAGGYDGLTVNARIAATGSGNIELSGRGGTISETRRGITFGGSSRLETANGNITLHGQGGSGGGYSHGIDGGGQIASNGGTISINGIGGENGGPNRGIRFTSMVITNTVGAIALNGVGGPSGNDNSGVLLESANNRIESAGGPITIDGEGGANGNSNPGIQIQANVTSNGGDISLTGTGGSGSNNAGIILQSSSQLSTTLTGAITISGTGGTGGEINIGVRILDTGTKVQTDQGDLIIHGISNSSSGSHNYGIQVSQGQVKSNSGQINLIGSGGDGNGYQYGIQVHQGQVTSNGGNLSLTGRGGSGGESAGVIATGGAQLSTTLTGAIVISGTGGMGGGVNVGVRILETSTKVQTAQGDITIHGKSNGTSGNWNMGIQMNQGQVTSNGGDLTFTGSGGSGDRYSPGVVLENGTQIATTLSGAIVISGTGGTSTAGDNWGVRIFNTGTKVQTAQGDLTIHGQSNGTSGDWNMGFELNGAQVASKSGDLTFTGNSGSGNSNNYGIITSQALMTSNGGNLSLTGVSSGGTNTNMGVRVMNNTTISTTLTGAIMISGTGGDGTEGYNYGVDVRDSSQIEVADGSLTVTGVGGSGTTQGRGISLDNSTVTSTGSAATTGAVTLHGTGSPSATSDNYGIKLYGGRIDTVAGDLQITGIGGANSTDNGWGIIMEGEAQISSAGTGSNAASLTITGTSSSGRTGYGLLSGWAGSTISTVDGTLTLNGLSTSTEEGAHGLVLYPGIVRSTGNGELTLNGASVNASDLYLNSATVNGGGADITINANTIDLWGNAISGSGNLLIQPRTPETSIGLGGGGGTLNLDDGELSRINNGFASITIGRVTNGTGAVTLDSATFNDPVTIAGGVIYDSAWASPDLAADTNGVILDGSVAPGPQPGWTDILYVTGDVTLAANHTFTVEVGGTWLGGYDQISVVGTVTISDNVTLNPVILNGFIPDGADTFTIINNDGNDPVVGTFAALAEGGTIPNFIGSGMDAKISYKGGDGNDVVITVFGPEISLWGNGESIYRDDLASRYNHTDFGRVKIDGGTVVHTFVISNTGNLPLNFTGTPLVALSGPTAAAFTVTAAPSNPVAAGTSTTVQITFDPNATGEFTATVTIASDDRNEHPYTFNIKGTGVVPNVSFNSVECDLIEAINAANSDAPSNDCPAGSSVVTDTITLLDDVILTDRYNYREQGLPEIVSAITIAGEGYTISRTVDAPEFRFFRVGPDGTLILNELTLRNGGGADFDDYGGVLYLYEGSVTINDSALIDNRTAYYGAALYNEYGTLTVNNSTLSGNMAQDYGGAIYNYEGVITLNSSTLSGNVSEYYGGAIYSEYGEVVVNGSTFSNNSAAYYGGAIYNTSGELTLTNSTLSGNMAQDYGGAIYNEYEPLTINNSTLTANSADYAGAIYNYDATITLNRTLLAGNSASSEIAEIYNDGGTVNADSFNLLGDNSQEYDQAFYDFTPGATDITATSDGTTPTAIAAILDPTLADNGGPTLTHALVAGSPALDAAGDSGLETDQRGIARPQGTADDIGAFELAVVTAPEIDVQGNGVSIANGDSTPDSADHTDFGTVTTGSSLNRTFTISNSGNAALTGVAVTLGGGVCSAQAAGCVASEFTLVTPPAATIAAGDSSAFTVAFAPSAIGIIEKTVSIVSNDSDENPYTFTISGEGEAPPAATTITVIVDTQPDLPTNLGFNGSFRAFFLDDPAIDDGDAYTNTKSFTVTPGRYTISRNNSTGWFTSAISCTPEGKATIDLTKRTAALQVAAGDDVTCTFTVARAARIDVRVFNDLVRARANLGKRNAGDPWLTGWSLELSTSPTNTIASQVTAVSGALTRANFLNLSAGTYNVCLILPDESWTASNPATVDPNYNQPCKTVTLTGGQAAILLFGAYQPTVSASDTDAPVDEPVTDEDSIRNDTDVPAEEGASIDNIFLPLITR